MPADTTPGIVLVAAAAENDVIGRDGGLPWRLPDDLAHFKRVTMGHAVIMGRATFEESGRPLPGRTNIVITTRDDWRPDGVEIARSLDDAIAIADRTHPGQDRMVIGGGRVFRLALPLATRIELTRVHAEVEGDTTFPRLDECWVEVRRADHPADPRHAFSFTFLTYVRRADA
ncbi:MAG: dihydrofolate reductase [Phycisphaerales bacterium]